MTTTPDPLKLARDALAFYADESRYHGPNVFLEAPDKWSAETGLTTYRLDVTRDRGVIASKALAEIDALPASVPSATAPNLACKSVQTRLAAQWGYVPASVPSGEPAEPMARFCPGCGSMGDVPSTYRDCCPDGGKARVIPAALAESCRDLFKLALDGVAAQAAPAPADAQEPQR